MFGNLSWLKISNTGTARTCRTYIFGDCCLYDARMREKRCFWRIWRIINAFLSMDGILYQSDKNMRSKTAISCQRFGGANIFNHFAHAFVFVASPSFGILFFSFPVCVFFISLFSLFRFIALFYHSIFLSFVFVFFLLSFTCLLVIIIAIYLQQ